MVAIFETDESARVLIWHGPSLAMFIFSDAGFAAIVRPEVDLPRKYSREDPQFFTVLEAVLSEISETEVRLTQ